ncbi:hypothetical protein C900_04472 [Fulvivirga imtechensis AK7]|uniref:Response regulator n=1 Tax=Fulvivirga imtechensis AK7 TaxID=1237149 RepID=L8JR22_9BACT|nr:hypothetical protein C900_04472 [Fulvivirga imtechensis AK7]
MATCLLIDDDPDEYEIFPLALQDMDDAYSCLSSASTR